MANLGSIAMLAEQSGILLVDKPAGLAAHDALKAVRQHFNLVKIGHGGTLEAGATGLFALLVGDATRIANDLMGNDCTWTGRLRLGRETDTHCAHGRVLAENDVSGVARDALDRAFAEWRGDVYLPQPRFSAIRLPGRADYEIVETAAGDELRERLVHVYRFAVSAFAPPFVDFELSCTKGVNVRALANAFGRTLGCGASVEEMRRVKCGVFSAADAIGFMDLLKLDAVDFKNRLLPLHAARAK